MLFSSTIFFHPFINAKYIKCSPSPLQVLVSSFLADGGDNYNVFVKNTLKRHPGNVGSTMVADYIRTESPIIAGEEDRIIFIKPRKPDTSNSTELKSGNLMIFAIVVLQLFRLIF